MDVVRVGKVVVKLRSQTWREVVVKFRSQTWWEDVAGPWQKVGRLWRLQ